MFIIVLPEKLFSNKKLFWKAYIEIFPMVLDSMKYDYLKKELRLLINYNIYTMHNKFSNCFVWVSPSTSDLEFHLLS